MASGRPGALRSMAEPARHIDPGKRLSSFADEVLVRCSRCDAPGKVQAEWTPYRWTGAFTCAHCDLALRTEAQQWVGAVTMQGRRACGHCGHKWLTVSNEFETCPSPTPGEWPALCAECGRESLVRVEPIRVPTGDRAIDPHFGLPLLLELSTRHGPVWAYNARHLGELRSYVGATLRGRRGTANGSIFSRLPVWMKVAKHRDEMLKAFDRLAQFIERSDSVATTS